MKQFAIGMIVTAQLIVLACSDAAGPGLPNDAEQFSPPPVYSTWWQMTQACSGLTGSMAAVTWYQTSEEVTDTHTGDVIAGYWVPGSNQIVLNSLVMLDGGTVRHEMLHALRQKGGHPRDQFLGKCAGVVACEDACVADAGPYPTPSQTPIHGTVDSIEVTIDIEPHTPTRNIDEGRFSITVLTRNKTARWMTVTPASTASAANQTFSVDVHGVNGANAFDELGIDPSQTIFGPGETKRHVFDLVIGDYPFGNQLLPGDYVARGAFAGYWTPDNSFTINP
ncbi:MAG: hypothetical protein ACJ8AK_13530 [Gemmatimonadaceae bacterium]